MLDLLREKPGVLLDGFLSRYCGLFPNIAESEVRRLIKDEIRCLSGEKSRIIELQDPENRWYDALRRGVVDFSVYDGDYYFADLWACWIIYSRKYLRNLVKDPPFDFSSVRSVLDLGCGVGYTASALKQMFPSARVSATNIIGTKQWTFCESMAKDFRFKLLPDLGEMRRVDLVFASEYFEYVEKVLEHLRDVLSLDPKFLVIANAFDTRSLGYFTSYEGGSIPQAAISRVFGAKLKAEGYEKVPTKFWNSRPTCFAQGNRRARLI